MRTGSREHPRGVRCADDPDHGVEIVERDLQAFQNVLAFASLAQQENRPPLHYVDAVVDEELDGIGQAQFLRLAVGYGQEDHGKTFLQLRVLVELIQHNLRLRAALEADHHPHAVAIAFIARPLGVGVDLGDDLVFDQLGDALEERDLLTW